VLSAAAGRLPCSAARWIGRRLGDVAYICTAGRRRTALANLAHAFPQLSPGARRRICRRSYRHLGLMVVELATMLARPLEVTLARVRLDGLEHLRAVMDTHGRALLLTAHLGNWELLPAANHVTGYPLSVVMRPLDARWLDGLATRLRQKTRVDLIDKRAALRPVLRALAGRGMVGILLDQNASRREGVFVPFFGRLASTSKSIAVLAIRTGTPIVPTFIRREDAGIHRIVVRPALPLPDAGDLEAAVVALTARCTEAIETAVRETPEQWLWMHNRWRTRPPEEWRERMD
jgi:KDO2-lipid IV(A) lauroyltransferase